MDQPLLHVCFSRPDEAWVVGSLLPQLGLAEGQYWTRAEDALGAPVLTEIERAVTRCRYTLLVASLAASIDDWVQYAGVLAQHAGLEDGRERLIIVARDFVPGSEEAKAIVPLRQRCLTYVDCSSPERMAAEVERLAQQLATAAASDQPLACPYPGLRAFGSGPGEFDRLELFFGREVEERALIDRVRGGAARLLLVGTSGSGKSSLMRARVLPALRRDGVVVQMVRPGRAPAEALRAALDALGEPTPGVRRVLYVDPLEEVLLADAGARAACFELLAGLGAVADLTLLFSMRADFYADLMRSPIWDDLKDHRVELAPLRGDGLRRAIVRPAVAVGVYVEVDLVERLVREADGDRAAEALPLLQATLEELWRKRAWRYLSLATYQQLAEGGRPGLDVALGRHADATLAALDEPRQRLARRVLIDLVNLGDGRPSTRRRRTRDELRRADDDDARLDAVLEHLAAHRLIAVGSDPLPVAAAAVTIKPPAPLVDLAHEALITGWPTFVDWMTKRQDAERTRRRFEDRAAEWARLKRRGGLLDDVELRGYHTWEASPAGRDLGASDALVELIDRSTTARSRTRWLRRIAVALLVAAVVAVSMLAVFNARNATRARAQEQSARHRLARSYIVTAQDLLQKGSAARATPYLLAAREAGEDDVPLRRLFRWASTGLPQILDHGSSVYAVAWSPDGTLLASASVTEILVWNPALGPTSVRKLGQYVGGEHLAWSPDGTMLATAGLGGARVFDPRTGDQLAELLTGIHVNEVAWSPDSRLLATAGADQTARIWDVRARVELGRPIQHGGAVVAVAWSPDGSRIASASDDKTVRISDPTTGASTSPPLAHEFELNDLAWSPDGAYLATSDAISVRVWDVATWTPIKPPFADVALIGALAWSPDGSTLAYVGYSQLCIWAIRGVQPAQPPQIADMMDAVAWDLEGNRIATSGYEGVVRVWDAHNGTLTAPLSHGARVSALAWGRNGGLATASEDGLARLWTLDRTPAPLAEPPPLLASYYLASPVMHTATFAWNVRMPPIAPPLASALEHAYVRAWSADGTRVALNVPDVRGVQVWDATATQPTLLDAGGSIWVMAWSPDGERLVTTTDDHASLWDTRTMTAVTMPFPVNQHGLLVAWSPDGTRISIATNDGRVLIWTPANGTASATSLVTSPLGGVMLNAIAWSPDGTRLATANWTGAMIWDLRHRDPVSNNLPCRDVNAIAWSPNSARVATAGKDMTTQIWDATTGRQVAPSIEHSAGVLSLAWSPDGSELATGTKDHLAQIWDATTGMALSPAFHHPEEVVAVSWNDDGSRLATVATDKIVRVWDVSWDHGTLDEWRAFLHGRYPYRLDRDGLLAPEP